MLEAQQDRRGVLRRHVALDRVRAALRGEGLDRAARLRALLDECREVGHDRGHPLAGEERHQVEPVRADVADRPQRAALVGLEPPVPVRLEEQPVLEVVAGHQPDVAEAARGDELAHVLVQRIEADVEVDRVDEAAPGGELDELCRIGRRHRQRLLADDVPPGLEDLARLRHVEVVGRGDVDDLDRRVVEQGLERGVGAVDAERPGALLAAFRRAAEDAADLHADPAQLLDVDGADEARADDGRADVGDPPHAPTCSLRRERLDSLAGSKAGTTGMGAANAGPCSATARTSSRHILTFPCQVHKSPGGP